LGTIDAARSTLLVIDLQAKLVPAIDRAAELVGNAQRLVDIAGLLGLPILGTEQNPQGLGPTVGEVRDRLPRIADKMSFDACREASFLDQLGDRPDILVAGCEAHVCVLQTVLGLIDLGRRVFVVSDAVGSRLGVNKEAGLRRMERHGAELVTTEMVAFELMSSANHPRFREILALVK
jgi:nicotinamidase-related amidase